MAVLATAVLLTMQIQIPTNATCATDTCRTKSSYRGFLSCDKLSVMLGCDCTGCCEQEAPPPSPLSPSPGLPPASPPPVRACLHRVSRQSSDDTADTVYLDTAAIQQ
eukprot:2067237-Prymnesium_polylepis.2